VKLFQVIKEGSLWGVYAVNANNPNDRKEVSNALTADEQFAIGLAAALNRIAATHNCDPDDTDRVDLSAELGRYDHPGELLDLTIDSRDRLPPRGAIGLSGLSQ
jgi:hypothetical protein